MKTFLLAAALFIAVGCGKQPPAAVTNRAVAAPVIPKPNDRQLIRQTVFLSLMSEFSGRNLQPVFFLVLEQGEAQSLPLAYKGWKVRSASDCVIDEVQGVKDKRTGEPGVVLEVKELKIQGDDSDVYTGYFAPHGFVLFTFRLKKKDGVWIILEKERRVVGP